MAKKARILFTDTNRLVSELKLRTFMKILTATKNVCVY